MRVPYAVLRLASWAIALSLPVSAFAQVTWTGADDTVWTGGTDATSFDSTFDDGDAVVFGNTGVGAISISGTVAPSSTLFNHTTGTYLFATGGTLGGSGGLTINGGGTVQLGSLTNSPTPGLTYTGGTSISNGSTLAVTRPGNIGAVADAISLNNGTLTVATDNSSSWTVGNAITVGAGGGTIRAQYAGNQSVFSFTGGISGSGALTFVTAGNEANRVNSGFTIGGDNTSYTGDLVMSSVRSGLQRGSGVVYFGSSANLFSNADSITTRNGGVMGFTYAVAEADLTNVTAGHRGGLGVRGASGSLVNLSNPLAYVGVGGELLLDNESNLNNNRLADTATLAMSNQRMVVIGRNNNGSATNEVIAGLTFTGGNSIQLDRRNSNNAGVDITMASLSEPGVGNTLLIDNGDKNNELGDGAALSALIVTGTKPAVTNGIVSPGIQGQPGGNTIGTFMTFSGDALVPFTAYTNAANATEFAAASTTAVVNTSAAMTLAGSQAIHALRVSASGGSALNLGGNTLTVGSGGIIMAASTISSGTLDFGATHGVIGAYNSSSQAAISSAITGSNGLSFVGSNQTLSVTGNLSGLSGGIYINSGSVRLGSASGKVVTVNALGRLAVGTSSGGTDTIGGLQGAGTVSGWVANAGTAANTLAISGSGSYSFGGNLENGNGTPRPLNLSIAGVTQELAGASTYTGTTNVTSGTLLVNNTYGSATGTGAVTIAAGATLGGAGTIAGTVALNGTIAPGNSPGTITLGSTTFGSNVTYNWELGSAQSLYDKIMITGTLDLNGSNLTMNLSSLNGLPAVGPYIIAEATTITGTLGTVTFDYTNAPGWGGAELLVVGNQIQLTAVPEPAYLAALVGVVALVFAARRRRRLPLA